MRERLLKWKSQDQFKCLLCVWLAFRILDDSFSFFYKLLIVA